MKALLTMRGVVTTFALGTFTACGQGQFVTQDSDATGGAANGAEDGGAGGESGSEDGSGGNDGSSTSTSVRAASENLARASCEYHERCVTYISSYGGLESCMSYLADRWVLLYEAPNTRFTLAEMDSCAVELATLSCSEVDCTAKFSGVLPAGAPCNSYAECENGYCQEVEDGCSVCIPYSKEGDPCDTVCELGLTCAGGFCRKVFFDGEDCDEERPCASRHECVEGVCVRAAKEGEPCSRGDWPQCESGFFCPTDSLICTPRTYVGDGEVCESVGACAVGDCKTVSGEEICFAKALPGETCGTRECVGNLPCENGICTQLSWETPVCE